MVCAAAAKVPFAGDRASHAAGLTTDHVSGEPLVLVSTKLPAEILNGPPATPAAAPVVGVTTKAGVLTRAAMRLAPFGVPSPVQRS